MAAADDEPNVSAWKRISSRQKSLATRDYEPFLQVYKHSARLRSATSTSNSVAITFDCTDQSRVNGLLSLTTVGLTGSKTKTTMGCQSTVRRRGKTHQINSSSERFQNTSSEVLAAEEVAAVHCCSFSSGVVAEGKEGAPMLFQCVSFPLPPAPTLPPLPQLVPPPVGHQRRSLMENQAAAVSYASSSSFPPFHSHFSATPTPLDD